MIAERKLGATSSHTGSCQVGIARPLAMRKEARGPSVGQQTARESGQSTTLGRCGDQSSRSRDGKRAGSTHDGPPSGGRNAHSPETGSLRRRSRARGPCRTRGRACRREPPQSAPLPPTRPPVQSPPRPARRGGRSLPARSVPLRTVTYLHAEAADLLRYVPLRTVTYRYVP